MLIGYELLEEHVGVIMGQVLEVNDADFDMVTKGNEWVLVDFWAPWCGPCKMIAPILKEIAGERDITIAKVNTDVNSLAPGKYNVRGIPNLILFTDCIILLADGRSLNVAAAIRPIVGKNVFKS